jgi:lysophospholipase L1-like esterase
MKIYILISAFLSGSILFAQSISLDPEIRMLALGDSYTIGESVTEKERWPVQFVEALQARGFLIKELDIIARTGWTTGELIEAIESRLDKSKDYNLVSLLIGVNNQYRGLDIDLYPGEFTTLLETAIDAAGDDRSKVLVLSIPDYAFTPFGGGSKKISDEIDAYNDISRKISASYGVNYINITDISRKGLENTDLVAADGLHPSGVQYGLWIERILDEIDIVSMSAGYPEGRIFFEIYPNPFNNYLNITGIVQQWGLMIQEITGREILLHDGRISSPLTLELGYLPSGSYLLTFYSGRDRFVYQIIKN